MQRRCARRCDQANAAWLQRQGAFTCCIKEAFALQLRLQTQKLLEQGTLPRALHALDDELQVPSGLVHADAPAQLHQFAIARRKVKQAGRAAEHGAAQLAVRVFD